MKDSYSQMLLQFSAKAQVLTIYSLYSDYLLIRLARLLTNHALPRGTHSNKEHITPRPWMNQFVHL